MKTPLALQLNYLNSLSFRLALGVDRLDAQYRAETAAYIKSRAMPDGGFAGRKGRSDIYYTGFALRSLVLLGELKDDTLAGQTENYIRAFIQKKSGTMSMVELTSVLMSTALLDFARQRVFFETEKSQREFLIRELAPLQRPDSLWAAMPGKSPSGVYHTFLALLCREIVNLPPDEEEKKRIRTALERHKRDDGSFAEMAVLPFGATNPTAAAVALSRILQEKDTGTPELEEESFDFIDKDRTVSFFKGMRTDEGGFRANRRIPFPDLLSTFTTMVALLDLSDWNPAALADWQKTERFIRTLRREGGYTGGVWDADPDVEYTFYALAANGILAGLTGQN